MAKAKPGAVRVGTSGWIYKHWRGVVYPAGLPVSQWFAHYASSFDTVEVNNTFYRLPAESAFAAWRRQAPPGFLYAIKASRFLTHNKKLNDPEGPLELLFDRLRALGPHLGPVLYQLPPRWHCNVDRLRRFLALLPRTARHVFEFRHRSWYTDAVREALDEYGAGFCIHDLRGSASPEWTVGRLVYLRFHGPTEKAYAGCYSHDHLRRWADRIEDFRREGRDVFAYFNNDDRGYAVANARTLLAMLAGESAVATKAEVSLS